MKTKMSDLLTEMQDTCRSNCEDFVEKQTDVWTLDNGHLDAVKKIRQFMHEYKRGQPTSGTQREEPDGVC